MTKEEFIKASKNFAKYYCGIKLPIDENSLIERDGCNYFFYHEFPSEYVDNDDNDVECTYWYSFSNFKDQRPEDGIEFATAKTSVPKMELNLRQELTGVQETIFL